MYKIKFDSHLGTGLFFVTEAKTPEEAKRTFYSEMPCTDKIKSFPQKTNKRVVEGITKRCENHWIVKI